MELFQNEKNKEQELKVEIINSDFDSETKITINGKQLVLIKDIVIKLKGNGQSNICLFFECPISEGKIYNYAYYVMKEYLLAKRVGFNVGFEK